MEQASTFISITGAPQAVAIRMLQENGGDLNAAVNAYFNDRDTPQAAPEALERPDFMEEDAPPAPPAEESRGGLGLRGLGRPPFDPLRSLFERNPGVEPAPEPIITHPRDVRSIPIDWQDPDPNLSIQEVTGHENPPPRSLPGIVSLDDDLPVFPLPSGYPRRSPDHDPYTPVVTEVPSVPPVDYEVEEEMLQAAIEESRRDAAARNDSAGGGESQPAAGSEDDDIARAVSLSLKTAEDEKRWRDLGGAPVPEDSRRREAPVSISNVVEPDEPEEQPLLRRRSRRNIQAPVQEAPDADAGQAVSAPQPNGSLIPSDEWGGISSEEQHEAVMLEAVFGGGLAGIPYPLQREFDPSVASGDVSSSRRQIPQAPLSPSVVAQRLLREQQDDEYLASLAADREKELKAKQEAEAATELERLRREEEQREYQAEAELERKLLAKAEAMPAEPSQDDESSVTILVRLPDGRRHGRRFRKSDRLQSLFDFIDISRAVKVGTYRLVRHYPRRTFTIDEQSSTLDSLGLTSKQEALFLETI